MSMNKNFRMVKFIGRKAIVRGRLMMGGVVRAVTTALSSAQGSTKWVNKFRKTDMEHQSKPLMRSLMYLHMNQTTNGNRAPIVPEKTRRHSTWLVWVLYFIIAYLLVALIITNGF